MPANERLRTAMLRTGTTPEDLASCCGTDVKTVERWLSLGRVPHHGNRWAAADRLGVEEAWLWPGPAAQRRDGAAQAELVRLYPNRASVPRETWLALMGRRPQGPLRPGHVRHLLRPDAAPGRAPARRCR